MNPNFTDVSTQLFVMMLFFIYHDFNYVIVTGENPLETLCVFFCFIRKSQSFFISFTYRTPHYAIGEQISFWFFFFHQYYLLDTMSLVSWSTGAFFIADCSFPGHLSMSPALHSGFSGSCRPPPVLSSSPTTFCYLLLPSLSLFVSFFHQCY